MAAIKESGPGSAPDLARQLMSKRIAVSIIRKEMDDYEASFVTFSFFVKPNHARNGRTMSFLRGGGGWTIFWGMNFFLSSLGCA